MTHLKQAAFQLGGSLLLLHFIVGFKRGRDSLPGPRYVDAGTSGVRIGNGIHDS